MAQPSLSPIALTPLVCMECSSKLRPAIYPVGRGTKPKKLDKIVYFCDTCQYGVEVTKQHVVCVNHKYEEKAAVAEPSKVASA
jgi:hypothetical protein